MKQRLALCLISFIGLTAQASPLSDHISQQYQQMAKAQQAFTQQVNIFCQNPKAKPSKTLRRSWKTAMGAWMAAQHINFGPIVTDNLGWTFQFWPDKKNLVKIKVEALLAQQDPSSGDTTTSQKTTVSQQTPISQNALEEASVIAQGYSALEFILFDKNAPSLAAQSSCAYLTATSLHLEKNISKLVNYWSEKKNQEALDVNPSKAILVINAVAAHVELIHKKLALPLSKMNPYFAESWRSQYSINNVARNLEGLEKIYQQVIRPWVLKNRNDQLKMRSATQLDDELLTAFQKAQTLTKTQPTLINSIKHKKIMSLQKLEQTLTNLKVLLSEKLPQFLGIMVSFNANDGD